ncbi:MAG: 4Fe-4S dicluster domain-containing protein [Planctomycetota bacterium]
MEQNSTPEPAAEGTPPSRRDVLGAALGAAAAGAADEQALFLPEEQWRDRMQAPDDGKRYGWVVDTRRCFGCHGCEVSCKAENDVPLGKFIRQTIYHDYEKSTGGLARVMVPMACQHCEDAPCIKACPCGALHKGAGGSVVVNYDVCSGHAACRDACPYGAIYIDPVANQAVKCHNCTHRVDVGMEPACVSTCPSEALYFGDLNDPESAVSKMKAKLEGEAELKPLRPEKGTNPRMLFAVDKERPMEAWEGKVPREGESYATDAYSVYSWGEEGWDGPSDDDAADEAEER